VGGGAAGSAEALDPTQRPSARASEPAPLTAAIATAGDAVLRELGGAHRGALVLLGSYGANEGVVARDETGFVHNDLDLALVVGGSLEARLLRRRCRRAGEVVSRAIGFHVDVHPVSRGELERPRGHWLWADAAVRGVRVLAGDERLVAALGGLGTRSIHPEEFARLLMNRALGLALSRVGFALGEADEPRRAARHISKAWLAAGDVLLARVDRYAPRLSARAAALRALAEVGGPVVRAVADGYAKGVAYREQGAVARATPRALAESSAALFPCYAHLEALRLGGEPCSTALAYAEAAAPRLPSLPDVSSLRRALGHARERLCRASWAVAFEPDQARAFAAGARLVRLARAEPRAEPSVDLRALLGALCTLRDRAA
jgi:hypothetical protein